jgi:DNA-binding NtrC family response regulator
MMHQHDPSMQRASKELTGTERALHEADFAALEQRIMELALEATGAHNGAIFLWDGKKKALAVSFHVVEGLVVTLPGALIRPRTDGRPNGIALWVMDHNETYLCADSSKDPHYARYFLDVASIAAVPIPYQGRPIGVLTVSARAPGAFTDVHVRALEDIATRSAKFLRRAQLDRQSREDHGRPFLIKGLSPEWMEVESRIERVAATNAPVLIHGESGTGKDLVARAIHFNSRRVQKPYVTVNCAAIPETLLESILFGHVRGAFTGASADKIGEFHKADGGTLFLDELGELPMSLQAKVLRAVEQGEVQPLGSNKPPERVDVRLICATNRDLGAMVRQGTFRDDLFYRLGVMTITIPALRTYKDNLEVLAHVLVEQAAAKHERQAPRIGSEAMAALHAYDFPGNVRELKNSLEHAVILAEGDEIHPAHLPRSMTLRAAPAPAAAAEPTLRELREAWLAPLEKRWLGELLARTGGNVAAAAERAGVNTVTLYRLLKKRGLKLGRTLQS